MPTYVAFLRAINLGPNRKFPKADIVGGDRGRRRHRRGDLHQHRQRAADQQAAVAGEGRGRLEKAYEAQTGFAVPTLVFTPTELAKIARTPRS